MDPQKVNYKTIDEYISQFTPELRETLQTLRNVINEAAPEAVEKISYQMPAFFLNGVLVYFAAFKDHISFFPTASGVEAFKDRLAEYKCSKGTVQFPFGKPLPYELISEIVRYRAAENAKKG